jgi:putative NIF3 family GTP cyclohydrolase 1 type 2
VYSPHTALDAVHGGLNDWLLDVLRTHLPAGSTAGSTVLPIQPVDRVTPATPAGVGYGRYMNNLSGVSAADVVRATKAGLGLERVQLVLPATEAAATRAGPAAVWAAAERIPCVNVAVCAGSGASILASNGGDGRAADVVVTGEMSHHELLNAASRGHVVILTNHSNSAW